MIEPAKHQLELVEKFIGKPYRFIGDSMGTGKTLSAILLDFAERNLSDCNNGGMSYVPVCKHRQEPFRTLIVTNKGGLSVWRWHLVDQGVDPESILVIDSMDRSVFSDELDLGAVNYSYYIMHYHALDLVPFFEKVQIGRQALVWDHIIVDEAHYIKNRNAKRTKTLKRQKARFKTALTGTPADDKPQDVWSIWNWLSRKDYSSYWRFFDEFIDSSEEVNHRTGQGYRKVIGVKNMSEYHRRVSPYYIRRRLTDVRDDMPEKVYSDMWVDLTGRQQKDYRQIESIQTALLGKYNEEYTIEWAIAVFMRLQQMTLGTVDELDWSHYERFWEKWASVDPEDPNFPKTVPTGPKFILTEPSPKLDVVMEKAEEAASENESLVVMTNYREVVKMLEKRCRANRIPISVLHGGITSQPKRDAAIADFQSGRTRVFVGTIGAAGTAITLTAAHTTLFTDRHWTPGVNRQAEDRIWRFDQRNTCQIIDISARETVDVDKRERIAQKAKLVDIITETPAELRNLL